MGQGQWATAIEASRCLHFDMGGESSYLKKIRSSLKNLCQKKLNLLFISHWDQDHYNFISRLKWLGLFQSCLGPSHPIEPQLRILKSDLPGPCIFSDSRSPQFVFQAKTNLHHGKKQAENRNHTSWVFAYGSEVLLPGDSTKEMEKYWLKNINAKFRHLIVGHHGSRTSTSKELIDSLPNLGQALISARKAKYGHPHIEVTHRLKKNGIAMIRTEDWGNIEIELTSKATSK